MNANRSGLIDRFADLERGYDAVLGPAPSLTLGHAAGTTPGSAPSTALPARAARANEPAGTPSGALIDDGFAGAIAALEAARRTLPDVVDEAAALIATSLERGGTLLICGNGGSAADAQHFAGELVGRFKDHERPALPALALNADTAILTAWANDAGYEDVFARQVEAYGRPGDVLVGISTSGRSANVIRAVRRARERGIHTVALTGGDGGTLLDLADVALIAPSADTQHVQAVHIVAIHLLCELIENQLGKTEESDMDRTTAHARRDPEPADRPRTSGTGGSYEAAG
jgi:phosphoheptose isomerase